MNRSDSSDAAYTRRRFLSGTGTLASAALLAQASPARAQPLPVPEPAPGATANPAAETLAAVLWDLVAASRILAHFGLIDGYGHVSVRNPINPNSYLMSAPLRLPPPTETLEDIGEFDLDNRPMDTKGRLSWAERFIFGSIYRARPEVQAILHCHDPVIVLAGVIDEPLRPIFHMAGFIGQGIPVFDLSKAVGSDTNLIIDTLERGHTLAQSLGDKPAVLMRGHGCAVVGKNLAQAVGRAVHLHMNCQLQAQASGRKIQYLSAGEARLYSDVGYETDWDLWKVEVMARSPSLYSPVG